MDRLLEHELQHLIGDHLDSPWLDLVADANGIGFFHWNVDDNTLRWNRGAEERLGLVPGTISSFATWASMVEPEDLDVISQKIFGLAATRATRLSYQYRLNAPGREQRLMEGVAHCIYKPSGILAHMAGVNFDITEREVARRELMQSEAQLRMIVDTVPDAMVLIGKDGLIRGFNAAAEAMFGFSAADVIGRNVAMLMPVDMASQHGRFMSDYLSGGPAKVIGRTRQLMAQRADGTIFPIELNVGEGAANGDRMFTGFIRDVSERYEAAQQFEALRDEYLRSARMMAMGEMAGGMAHELNQPLAAATNYLAVVEIAAGTIVGDDGSVIVDNARKAASSLLRSGEIIRRLRSFVGPKATVLQAIDIASMLDEALALALPRLDRQDLAIQLAVEPPGATIVTDKVQIQQVLVNLIRNAWEAMRDLDRPATLRISASLADGAATISVADNGPGIPEAIVAQRGGPFYSTKGPDSLGFGLSISRRIVEAFGGFFLTENRPEGGAVVSFTLPMPGESE